MSNEAQGQQDYNSGATDFNAQSFAIEQLINKIQTLALVKVLKCTNAGTISPVGFVDVQPMVNQMTGKREAVAHGVIYNIPYFRLQGGVNAIIIDPEPGDIGVCGFCSRDISNVKITKKIANPGSFRKYAWADGLYFGGFLNAVPTNYIALNANGITLTSPVKVTINAPEADINANVKIVGNTEFTGTLTANNKVIDDTHTHVGTQPGTGITGAVS